MGTPHKHAELIKAWADGAEIEYRVNDSDEWRGLISPAPTWNEYYQYRIKPEEKKPVVRWIWARPGGLLFGNMYTEKEAPHGAIRVEGTRTEFSE